MTFKTLTLAAALAVASTPSAIAFAQASDPGAATVESFDAALLDAMKQAKSLGVEGRYRKLDPAVQQAFDLPTMTRFAVGPAWATVAPADQAALIKAFARLSVATYAHNFDGYGGERFTMEPKVETRGPDKLVRSHIVSPHDKPVDLTYRMRQAADGRWKIIDVYYNGSVSELAARRSDFAASMANGGAPALVKKINALADKLLKS